MSVVSKKKKSNSYKPLSERDQKKLEDDVQRLTYDQKREVIDLLKDTVSIAPSHNTSLVFDIGKLPARKQRELKHLVNGWTEQPNGSSHGSLVGQIRATPSQGAPSLPATSSVQ